MPLPGQIKDYQGGRSCFVVEPTARGVDIELGCQILELALLVEHATQPLSTLIIRHQ
jgi:hypothetical protein